MSGKGKKKCCLFLLGQRYQFILAKFFFHLAKILSAKWLPSNFCYKISFPHLSSWLTSWGLLKHHFHQEIFTDTPSPTPWPTMDKVPLLTSSPALSDNHSLGRHSTGFYLLTNEFCFFSSSPHLSTRLSAPLKMHYPQVLAQICHRVVDT